MRANLLWAFVACVLCTRPTAASDEPSPEEAAVFDVLTYYYLEKDTKQVPKFLQQIEEMKLLDKHESAAGPVCGFMAVVFEENPKRVTKFAKCAPFSGNAKKTVIRALWLSGNGDKIEKIFGDTPAYAKKKAVNLHNRPFKNPGDLDMMWGAFLASGDASYPKRLIDLLDEKYELPVDDEEAATAMRMAAEWSLKSNMFQHELIHRMIVEEENTRTGSVRKKLRDLLDSVPNPELPNKDGDFSADLLLMDAAGMAEFSKPTNEPLKITTKKKAKQGDIIGIKVVFSGIALDEDLEADVHYDLKILDPEGKIYSKSDMKDLKALNQKVPTRFRFFDNAEVVSIRFEPKDKLGKYEVLATVRDKIGKKSIKLKRSIELTN